MSSVIFILYAIMFAIIIAFGCYVWMLDDFSLYDLPYVVVGVIILLVIGYFAWSVYDIYSGRSRRKR
jgi:4-amino-4-deoxy-L-arabinose transferase-like glycosyltransferase